jgi:molecular chaperone Hsp33
MHDRDCLHRFVFERYPIRGHLVHLDAAWRALIEHREYPEGIQTLLGEAVAASLLLAATVKFDGVLSLQLQGDGLVQLLLAQCTAGLGVRGLARFQESGDPAVAAGGGAPAAGPGASAVGSVTSVGTGASAAARETSMVGPGASIIGPGTAALGELIGAGNLTVTLETDAGSQRYQGIVPISGDRLADSLQGYFENSEQLPTRLWLYADANGASGMLLQRLPGDGGSASQASAAEIDDAWRRVQLIGDTLTREELRTLKDAEILHRLFNEDDLRLFEPSPVYFRCRCSRERVGGMLQGLGEAETLAIVKERGEVEVRCDFCNRAYVFDAVDVARLFNAGVPGSGGGTIH